MRFSEINLFGVCVAPVSLMLVGAWLALLPLRYGVYNLGLAPRLWHPPLFWSSVYVILVSAIVIIVALWGR